MDMFVVLMAIACVMSLLLIAFLLTIFVILCVRSMDPTVAQEAAQSGVRTMATGGRGHNGYGEAGACKGFYHVASVATFDDDHDDSDDLSLSTSVPVDDVCSSSGRPSGTAAAAADLAGRASLNGCGSAVENDKTKTKATEDEFDLMLPTALTSVIGQNVTEFELITSTNV